MSEELIKFLKTYTNDEGFHVSAILMENKPIFLPSELEEQFGYSDLGNSIRNSTGLERDVDYLVLDGDKLKQLKELLGQRTQNAPAQISKFATSLIVLTESGLIVLAVRSDKSRFKKFRIWVTSEVIPSIIHTENRTNN